MTSRAWVTLATNDSYGLGALVLAHSLRRVASTYPAVVLITPTVTDAMRERLRAVFAEVITVDVLDSQDAAHLALLQRPELGITFTKIHCWNLTQYEKCVFLDADILVVQNCDELFEREELTAAPDVGWPDCFNSGVFVFKPSSDTFSRLITFARERGSFDGGDQGLLNSFFSDWSSDNNKRLPFLYNVTSGAFYSYLPALKHFGQNLKIIHFIGPAKPWLQHYNFESQSVDAPEHLKGFLQLWWDLFTSQVHTQLDVTMTGVAGNLARVQPGVPLQREAVDELSRRQGWESGNIDYMGADSFANIWAKISETLSQGTSSPPKQPSPPKECYQAPLEKTKEAVQDLAEKVTAKSLDESNDIPVPAREAAHATGKTSNSSPEINKKIEGTAPQSNLESIPQLPSVTETEVLNTEPVSDVPAVISQLETSMAASKIESEAIASTNVHETKSPEPITSTEMHENEPKNENDFPKSNIISEQSTDVHVPEIPIEPIVNVPAPTTVEAALEALSEDGTVSVQSDLHESNVASAAEFESKPVSQPSASASKVEVESPSESHESKSPEVSVVVPPVSTPLPPKTETENNTTEPELSIVQDAKVASVPEVNKPQTVSASEIPSDVPTIDPKPVIPIDIPKSESDSLSRASEQDKTPEKADAPVSDSPPLANTPSQEEASSVPAAKSEERRKPVAKLQLKPPTAADPLPTPDSELEDAASLAQSIIASELRTPTVTSPSPTACLASPQLQTQQQRLDVKKPDVPTPPVGAVSLSQIGIKPKAKPTTASQIESSVTEKEAEPPKKKVVKKVVKKDGASSGEAPVPPPRKKEKKPKDK